MAANDDKLIASVKSLQDALETVSNDISKRADLNKMYADENKVFDSYAMELSAFEGKLSSDDDLSGDEVQKIAQETVNVIAPQITDMISNNTKIQGMGQLDMNKVLTESSINVLNASLSDSKKDLQSFYAILQQVEGPAAQVQAFKMTGKPQFTPAPTLKQLSAAFGDALKKISYAKG